MRSGFIAVLTGIVAGFLVVVLPYVLATDGRGAAPVTGFTQVAAAAATPAAVPTPACQPAPLTERAGLVLLVGLPATTVADQPLVAEVLDVGVGGVLLTKVNVEDAAQVTSLVDALEAGSAQPLVIATDEEPGRVSSFGTVLGRSSSARTLAARGTAEDTATFARELGAALAEFGVTVDLAPVADVDDGPAQSVIGDRAFSGDPEVAAAHALAFSQGMTAAGVLPTAKHFPGHGRAEGDSHIGETVVDAELDDLVAVDLVPFMAQIEAGVPLVMLSHVSYAALTPDLPASLDPLAYELLRDLGFEGVAVTDSLGMGAIHLRWAFPEAAVMAVAAGADLVLATDGTQARAMRDALVTAVESGRIPEARLDQAVRRVLALSGHDGTGVVCP